MHQTWHERADGKESPCSLKRGTLGAFGMRGGLASMGRRSAKRSPGHGGRPGLQGSLRGEPVMGRDSHRGCGIPRQARPVQLSFSYGAIGNSDRRDFLCLSLNRRGGVTLQRQHGPEPLKVTSGWAVAFRRYSLDYVVDEDAARRKQDQYLIRTLRHAMGLAVAATNAMMQHS